MLSKTSQTTRTSSGSGDQSPNMETGKNVENMRLSETGVAVCS